MEKSNQHKRWVCIVSILLLLAITVLLSEAYARADSAAGRLVSGWGEQEPAAKEALLKAFAFVKIGQFAVLGLAFAAVVIALVLRMFELRHALPLFALTAVVAIWGF